MTKYLVRRLFGIVPTLLIIVTLGFFVIRIAPGGPFASEKALPPAVMANVLAKYHLDEPLPVQYARYMLDVLHGDLGPSYTYADYDVAYYIRQNLPNSLLLGAVAMAISVVLGIGAGMTSATHQNRWNDYLSMSVAVVGISVPLFVIGPVLMYFLAVKLQWLPTSGWIDSRHGLKTLIMPAVTLSLPQFAYIARLSRASILDVLRSDYIRTAFAKGLHPRAIMFRHVLKGALLPVVSYLGPAFASVLTGSVVVERIFRVPGMGTFFVQSAFNRDYTLIMGTVIVFSVLLVVLNFVVDALYAVLDPRISYR